MSTIIIYIIRSSWFKNDSKVVTLMAENFCRKVPSGLDKFESGFFILDLLYNHTKKMQGYKFKK